MKLKNRHLRLMPWVGVLGLAVGLRLAMIFSIGTLWADEAFSWHFARLPFWNMLHNLRLDVHPPFHATLLWFWMRLFGESPIVMRLLSLFLAIGGLVTFKLLGIRLFGKRVAFLALLLASFSPLMIYYSADGRMYALIFFLASFSALAFWEYVHHHSHKALNIWFYASLALSMTHITGALVIFSQGAYLFSKKEYRSVFWTLFTRFVAIAGLFFVWFIPATLHKLQMLANEWQFRAGTQSIPVHKALAHWIWITPNPKMVSITIFMAGIFIVGGVLRHTKRKPFINFSDRGRFLFWWLFSVTLPFVLAGITVTPRYLAGATPALFLLIAFGYMNIVRRSWYATLLAGFFIVFITFPGIASLLSIRSYNWDTNVSWIEERYKEGDALVFGWYANRLPFEAVGGFHGILREADASFFYPFDDNLTWDERYVAHAGTLTVDYKKINDFFGTLSSKKRFFYIPNHFLRMKNGESAGPVINNWFKNHGWYLEDALPNQGRSVGVWLMVKK